MILSVRNPSCIKHEKFHMFLSPDGPLDICGFAVSVSVTILALHNSTAINPTLPMNLYILVESGDEN